jgi:hypothetical protein
MRSIALLVMLGTCGAGLPPEDRANLQNAARNTAAAYRYADAGAMPSASAWEKAVAIMRTCAELAGLVIPVVGAVSGVFGLAQTKL